MTKIILTIEDTGEMSVAVESDGGMSADNAAPVESLDQALETIRTLASEVVPTNGVPSEVEELDEEGMMDQSFKAPPMASGTAYKEEMA